MDAVLRAQPALPAFALSEAVAARRKAPALRPEGHNAFWEGARPWLIFIGATVLTTIATYVMAKDSIDRLHAGGSVTDIIAVAAAVGLGALVDAAIVISGMRTHQERSWWRTIATLMFVACIGVEGMTLLYFYYLIQPESVPGYLLQIIQSIHDLLFLFRGFLPPIILAFLGVGVRNLVFSQADRKRRMLEQTGARLMTLEERLADPADAGDKPELIREYEAQLALFEYASDATEKERAANAQLVATFRRIWGLAGADAAEDRADILLHVQAQMDAFRQEFAGNATKKGKAKAGQSGTDILSNALAQVGVMLLTKATKSENGQDKTRMGITLKGGWIAKRDIETLSGGKVGGDKATEMAGRLGEGYKSGTQYACPLRPVLKELAERSALIEPVLTAWKQVQRSDDSAVIAATMGAESGNLPHGLG